MTLLQTFCWLNSNLVEGKTITRFGHKAVEIWAIQMEVQ